MTDRVVMASGTEPLSLPVELARREATVVGEHSLDHINKSRASHNCIRNLEKYDKFSL